ncbi:MAG: diaminopimelate decarboxylase [Actinobacteria bacterium]|nr:diaminopimelate decarboxylase [Actinomycetota bacterium]
MNWNTELTNAFGPQAGRVYYAAKAFICVEVARWIADLGIGIDVCTGGELAVALKGGIDPAKIELHGNNKSEAEIERAVSVGVGTIVIDSLYEIERVATAATKHGVVQKVLLRLTPGIEAQTHESIATAHEDVKFGFSIASGAAWKAITQVRKHSSLELRGFHAHIGSQIFENDSFEISAKRLIELLAKYRDEYSAELPELDLGGGYGIAYLPGENSLDPESTMKDLAKVVNAQCAAHKLALPHISIEPGRAIVGPTMFTLYEVGTVKDVTLENGEIRRYVSIDGGMSDNLRPALYDAQYFAALANRTSSAPKVSSRIVGKHCETGDILIREIDLENDIVPGDLLATPATGAYGRSMATNYNHVPRPPVIAVKDGKARVILRRETEADLLTLDI